MLLGEKDAPRSGYWSLSSSWMRWRAGHAAGAEIWRRILWGRRDLAKGEEKRVSEAFLINV